MGRRPGARGRIGGGDRISPPRESRVRVATAFGALGLLAGLVAYPAVAGDRLVPLVALVGVVGWLLLALGLAGRWPLLLAWGLATFGGEYALFLRLNGGSVDSRAPFVAAALLLVAELAFQSIGGGLWSAERGVVARTAVAGAAAVGGAALVGDLLLVASGSANAGLALEGAGVAAAVLAVAGLVRVAARTREPNGPDVG